MDWSEDAAKNHDVWTKGNAEYTDARADVAWAKDEIDWGIWDHPESDVGCGTADAAVTGLPAASFDLVLSEYGASIWVDPYRWIPEAARLLRPGGRLVFLRISTLAVLCSPEDENAPVTDRLQRPQYGLHRIEWVTEGVEFHLGHGDWIDLLHTNSFELERLVELYPAEGAAEHPYYSALPLEWARRWPAEEIWVGRKAPRR